MSRDVVLQSFGAARTVTGSRHLLAVDGRRVLLDCGMFQGHRRESNERNRHIPIEPDVVVLSHAHIDHSGALPALVRGGYRGPIHATKATIELCSAMLRDSARIAAYDAKYLNKKRAKGELPIEPIYTEADVEDTLELMAGHEYEATFEILPGVHARFQDAGHIIGSAGVLIDVDQGPDVYFTGDVGRRMYPILRDPVAVPDVDVVLSECTYGTRDHPPADLAGDALAQEIERVLKVRGRLLIPAFSVGRAQNLVYAIAKHWQSGRLPRLPVFVDSPLAERATEVFVDHPEAYDDETEAFMSAGGRPFFPKGVRYLQTSDQSKELNELPGPWVVIAGSGMCEGGRIVHHLKKHLAGRENTVLIVGWQAPHTLGRRLLENRKEVRVLGRTVEVNARIARINAYSAHAGRADLIDFLAPARDMDADVFLVHGEEQTALAFADTLRDEGHAQVVVPQTYARYPLRARTAVH